MVGFRNKDLVILEKEFEAVSAQVVKMSDDGSWGEKGLGDERAGGAHQRGQPVR